MHKVDEQNLRAAIAEEVEALEPSDRLWTAIYEESVLNMQKQANMQRKAAWKKSLMALTAAAAAVVMLVAAQGRQASPPPVAGGPSVMSSNDGFSTLPAGVDTLPAGEPAFEGPAESVKYRYASYFLTNRTVTADQLGGVLMKTHQDKSGKPPEGGELADPVEGDGYSTFFAPGTEIRTINGVDPKDELAAMVDGEWHVLDSFLEEPIAK